MTNKQLAKAVRDSRGEIKISMMTPNDSPWVVATKKSLLEWLEGDKNEVELDLQFVTDEYGNYITSI